MKIDPDLRRLPPGSLGRLHQERFDRLCATHGLHHVVLAIPSHVAGEASGSADDACGLRQPGSIAVLTASMVHSYLAPGRGSSRTGPGSETMNCRWRGTVVK